jgi:hypothetical protein
LVETINALLQKLVFFQIIFIISPNIILLISVLPGVGHLAHQFGLDIKGIGLAVEKLININLVDLDCRVSQISRLYPPMRVDPFFIIFSLQHFQVAEYDLG